MNKQLKKLFTLGVLFVGISTLLWNCEKETLTLEKENSPTAQNNKDLVGYIVKPDSVFKANKKIKDYITKTFSSKSKNNSKAIVSDIYGFSIDTTKVQIIVASSYQSYTFYVERENSTPDILENYVLNIFNDGGYNQLLISYPVTEINGEINYNISAATATYINDPNLLAKGVQCANASEEIIAWDPDAGVCVDYNCKAPTGNGQHAPGDACSAIGEDRAHTECSGGWVVTGCINYGGSGSGFGGGGSSGGSSGGVSDGSSGGDTNIDVSDNFDDPNIGVVPFDLVPCRIGFARKNGVCVPIEEIIIDSTSFTDYPCQKEIIIKTYENNSELANIITSTFSGFNPSNINLTFKNEILPANGQVGHTDIYAEEILNPPFAEPKYNINITIDTDYLQTATDLAIATTIIHEQVHAFLVYLHETGLLTTNSTEPGYNELMQAYVQYKADHDNVALATTQHEYMTNMVDKMTDDLFAFGLLRGIQGADRDYCNKLIWGKLMDTETFKNKFPQFQTDGDYNPDYIVINQATLAEAKNETKQYVHSNGITYSNSPKGSPCI
jgi:hypothetical protein